MEAIKVAVQKRLQILLQKFLQKKSYAPPGRSMVLLGVLRRSCGDGAGEEVVKAVGDFIRTAIASGGSGQRAAQRRADQQYARQEKNPSSRTSTNQLVARDNRMIWKYIS